MRTILTHVAFIFIVWCVSITTTCAANTDTATLIINSGANAPLVSNDGDGFYNFLVDEIFKRLQLPAKCVQLPPERALINANTGIDDGIIARIAGLETKYPDLIRVPVSVLQYDFVAYAAPDFAGKINQWKDLSPYVVGYIQGWKIYEKSVTEAKLITKVKTPKQLFQLIENKRADVVLFDRLQGQWWLKRLNIESKMLTPALTSKEMYMYMNKKHRQLVNEIANTISAMKKDGTYQKLLNQSLLQ